jgi:hypothetical protein
MTTAAYSLKKIKVIGISMNVTTCECCGKEDLSKTVKIQDLESGIVMHFGTTCAAKANKYDNAVAAAKAEKEIKSAIFFAKAWAGISAATKARSMEGYKMTEDQLFQQYVTTGQI